MNKYVAGAGTEEEMKGLAKQLKVLAERIEAL